MEGWCEQIAKDVAEARVLSNENREERRLKIEQTLHAIKVGQIPPTRIFDVIRAHVIINLAGNDVEQDDAIGALEQTVEKQPTGLNYLLLYAALLVLAKDRNAEELKDKATLLLDKVALPE